MAAPTILQRQANLQPASQSLIDAANVPAGNIQRESGANGLWVGILSRYFPFPAYMIAPEYYTSAKGRADLMVIETATGRPVFAFEGKASDITSGNFGKSSTQLLSYLEDIVSQRGIGKAVGIFAAGNMFQFQIYVKDAAEAVNAVAISSGPGIFRVKAVKRDYIWDLTKAADRDEAHNAFIAAITEQYA